jgi:hypothetical protein
MFPDELLSELAHSLPFRSSKSLIWLLLLATTRHTGLSA